MLKNVKGIKRINDSMYTEAHTMHLLPGLEKDLFKIRIRRYLVRDIH